MSLISFSGTENSDNVLHSVERSVVYLFQVNERQVSDSLKISSHWLTFHFEIFSDFHQSNYLRSTFLPRRPISDYKLMKLGLGLLVCSSLGIPTKSNTLMAMFLRVFSAPLASSSIGGGTDTFTASLMCRDSIVLSRFSKY